jgi:peroxiredoxin
VQLRHYVELQEELAINYCKLTVVSVDSPEVNDAFRTGLRASFPFLSDQERKVVKLLDHDRNIEEPRCHCHALHVFAVARSYDP